MTLLQFLDNIAQEALVRPDEYFKPGHNGPYFHPETPVRIKSHWLITFCKLYGWTGKPEYKEKAWEFAQYLLSSEARPEGYSFYHRNKHSKDKCNGLVGQAWTFEALAQAAETFQDDRFKKLAEDVFLLHHFNEQHGLWNILEVNGRILPIDNAPNHQLWFAAGMGQVGSSHPVVIRRINHFLDNFLKNTTVLDSGLIYHEFDFVLSDAYARSSKVSFKTKLKRQLKNMLSFSSNAKKEAEISMMTVIEKKEKLWEKMKRKSIGYHGFNMYALSMLQNAFPDHPIWKTDKMSKMVNYLTSEEYICGIEDNQFSFAYNPPGIEVPYSLATLKSIDSTDVKASLEEWFTKQVDACFNPETYMFDLNNKDITTLTARMYELTRFNKDILEGVSIYEMNKNLTK